MTKSALDITVKSKIMTPAEILITREGRIKMAQFETKKVAEMKDFLVKSKYNREQREAARRLTAGNGYLEMTQADAHKIDEKIEEFVTVVKFDEAGNPFTEHVLADHEKKIWGYMYNSTFKKIQLTAF